MLHLANQYLIHRRKFGFVLKIEGQFIQDFARFADRTSCGKPLTVALALRWATLARGSTLYHAKRLEALRGFARYCAVLDSRVEIPPTGLLGTAHRRIAPHIYTAEQVSVLINRARGLPPAGSLRAHTFVTLIGLLSSTGLRVIEARRLRPGDFDADAGTLKIAPAKASPQRVLPLHPTSVRALLDYQEQRRRRWPFAQRFFVSNRGNPLCDGSIYATFRSLVRDIKANGGRRHPRLYDFRHTFATNMIARWNRERSPVAHHLVLLSRYLGHQSFLSTYWYVSSTPQMMARAAGQFQRHWHSKPNNVYEPDLIPIAAPALLRGASDRATRAEPANRGRLPRYLPPAAAISLRPPPLSR